MSAGAFVFLDGLLLKADKASVSVNNRSFRYGDGCFETMKVVKGKLVLSKLHMERLFKALQQLQFDLPGYFTAEYLEDWVIKLVEKNQQQKLARIRLMIFRGDGGLYDPANHFPHCLIQSWSLQPAQQAWNENGLVTDIYRDAVKAVDSFSSLKHNNYLPYAMAALWVKRQQLNEAILLNPSGNLADATIHNVWIIQGGVLKTTALSEGAVDGVMRKFLLQEFQQAGLPVETGAISTAMLEEADGLFFTNSIHGIRWARSCGNTQYSAHRLQELFQDFVAPLWR